MSDTMARINSWLGSKMDIRGNIEGLEKGIKTETL